MDDLLIQRGQEPARTRLVLLHGWGADARDLLPLGEILSQASGLAIECMALNAPELHPAGSGRQWYGLFPEQWADASQAVHELKQRIEADMFAIRTVIDDPTATPSEVEQRAMAVFANLDEATAYAAKIPTAAFGSIEVRPVMEM